MKGVKFLQGVSVFLFCGLFAAAHAEIMPVTGPDEGNIIPEFTLPDLSGKKVSISGFRGKKVILYHWATWCTCRFQLIPLQKFSEENKSKNLVMVTVAYDSQGEKHVMPFLEKHNIKLPVLVERTHYLSRILNFNATQNAYLIDEAGVIKKKWIGDFFMEKPEIAQALADFVKEKPVSVSKSDKAKTANQPSLSELHEKVKASPSDADLRYQLGIAYSNDGKYTEAAAEFEEVAKLKPSFAENYYRLGVMYYLLGDVTKTRKLWRKAMKYSGFNYFYYRSLNSLEHPEEYYKDGWMSPENSQLTK